MLTIAIELLTGRYAASAFDDWDAPEWPPHPGRFFSALVAAWGDVDDPDPAEREALEWLEALDPPELSCDVESSIARRAAVTTFVPVNDPAAVDQSVHAKTYAAVRSASLAVLEASDAKARSKAEKSLEKARTKALGDGVKAGAYKGTETGDTVDNALATLPENRSKQARSFPCVVPAEPSIWLSWPSADPSPDRLAAIDRLCSRVGRLGHSSTLVTCRAGTVAPPAVTYRPKPGTGRFVRVMKTGLLAALDDVYERTGGRSNGPLPRVQVEYAEGEEAGEEVSAPSLAGDWFVWTLPSEPLGGRPVAKKVTRTLELTRALRGALIAHCAEPVPEVLLGHPVGAARGEVSTRSHAAVVALPNAAHRQADAGVMGLALVLPAAITHADRLVVEAAMRSWQAANRSTIWFGGGDGGGSLELDAPRVEPAPRQGAPTLTAGPGEQRATLRRSSWCRSARTWTTVTPIALDRFPGDIGSSNTAVREKAEEAAARTVARACEHAGLPQPIAVEVDRASFLASVPHAGGKGRSSFPTFRSAGSGQVRLGVHARITFGEPVAGPVLLGAGRYLGYGLCTPVRSGPGR